MDLHGHQPGFKPSRSILTGFLESSVSMILGGGGLSGPNSLVSDVEPRPHFVRVVAGRLARAQQPLQLGHAQVRRRFGVFPARRPGAAPGPGEPGHERHLFWIRSNQQLRARGLGQNLSRDISFGPADRIGPVASVWGESSECWGRSQIFTWMIVSVREPLHGHVDSLGGRRMRMRRMRLLLPLTRPRTPSPPPPGAASPSSQQDLHESRVTLRASLHL